MYSPNALNGLVIDLHLRSKDALVLLRTAPVVVRPFPPLKSTKNISSLRHYADARYPSSRFGVLSSVTDREPVHRTTGAT